MTADHTRYEQSCAKLCEGLKGLTLDTVGMWEGAQKAVEIDFRIQENRDELFLEADFIRRKIFPWATLPVTELPSDTGPPL
jgi:hypothetical protein